MKKHILKLVCAAILFIPLNVKAHNNKCTGEVVIAVIDTGVDTGNPVISNSLMKDKSGGFAGWNFLGDTGNENNPVSIGKESFRIMQLLHNKYSQVVNPEELDSQAKAEYENYKFFRSKARIDGYLEFAKLLEYNYLAFSYMDSVILSQKGDRDIKITDLNTIDYSMIPDSMETPLSQVMTECTKAIYSGKTMWTEAFEETKQEYLLSSERVGSLGDPYSNPRFSIGDDPYDFNNTKYGNNNIAALPNEHATSIISLIVSLNEGFPGINPNSKILPLRVVPSGEAFDKDLYSAIFYAINKGADIILIPQAKEYSLFGEKLSEAIAFAGENEILVVLASGDNSMEITEAQAVPSAIYKGKKLSNVIRVGALGKDGNKMKKSNYGAVDMFAIGEIASMEGSNVSSALIAGAASRIKSEFRSLSAAELKEIVLKLNGDLSNLPEVIDSERLK